MMIGIIAFILIGGSYLLAGRFLPAPKVIKVAPWMAGAALIGYYLTQFVVASVLTLLKIPTATIPLAVWVIVSALGAFAGAALVLRRFVLRYRLSRAERDAF